MLLLLCFTLSLESAPFVCSSASFWYQFLHFRLTYSFTLQIHNGLSLSQSAVSQILTPVVLFFLSGCLRGLLLGPILLSYSVFVFMSPNYFFVSAVRYCARLSWTLISSAFERTYRILVDAGALTIVKRVASVNTVRERR